MEFYNIDGLSFFVLMDEYCRFPIVNDLKITINLGTDLFNLKIMK